MEPIRTYEDLCGQVLAGRDQYWYYVFLINPMDLSPAGNLLFENLQYLHLDSGKQVVYFIPGFLNGEYGPFDKTLWSLFGKVPHLFGRRNMTQIPVKGFGVLGFSTEDFVDCIHNLERNNPIRWRYSGECELLLFNLDQHKKIIADDFYSYNLDDIVRNRRQITEFIRETIHVGADLPDKRAAKRRLDEVYEKLIMPVPGDEDDPWRRFHGFDSLRKGGFVENRYDFISYSSRDYEKAVQLRKRIEGAGTQCWMAPRDIPHGTNYAHIIELAIRNARRFVLLLSESSVWSVWVEKELLRAIHYFRYAEAERIFAFWIDRPLLLDETPMGYPLEGLQITEWQRYLAEVEEQKW